MMIDKKKSVFYDKRDENYIQLSSPIFFLEMFTKKKIKCDIIIPQTIIFSKGTATLWLFNSKSSPTPIILKKNSNKLNFVEICRVLCKVKHSDDFRIDTLTTLLDIIKAGKNDVAAFARISKTTRTLNKIELVKTFLDGNIGGLSILQENLVNYSKADELYYVEYRQDVLNLPVSYRFFKKSTQKQVPLPTTKRLSQLHQQQQTQHSDSYDDKNKHEQIEFVDCLFKFFDNAMNQNLQKIIKKMVDFLEKSYKIRVKKLIAKFMQNDAQLIYFLGLKELLIDFHENSPYEIQSMRNELKDNNSFENLLILIKMFTRMRDHKPMKIPQTIYEDDKEISQKLYKNLIVQKCVGDFCEYIMEEKNRGPLQIRKNIITDYKKYFGNKKMNEEKFSVTLPHEISYQLILRTRECSDEVIEVLMKNKIFTRNSKHHFQEFDKINTDEEYPFKFNKTEVYNLPNLYKTVKICKNCFVVYSLASKYFDQRLSNDLQQKQWIKKESSSLALQKTSANTSQQLSAIDRTMLNRAQSGMRQQKNNNNQSLQKIKTQISQYNPENDQNQKVRKIQSANQFRVIQSAHSQPPKTFKLFMPSSQQNPENSKLNSQNNRTNNIDINRLTMGFLNYTKPPRPGKIHSAKPGTAALQSQRSQMESQHIKRSESQSDQLKKRMSKSQKLNNPNKISLFQAKLRFIDVPQNDYTLLEVCKTFDLDYPPESVPDIYLESVNYFCYQQCAIPYLILQNLGDDEELNQSGLDLTEKEHQTVIFLGDFFDNAFEYLDVMQNNIKQNQTILLMNLPGQSYTIFDPTVVQDNLNISLLLDSLLFELNQKGILKNNESLKFLGYGYGGFQILSYLSHIQCNLPKIEGVLILNGFCEIDEMLADTLKKSKEVFQTCPEDMPELGFHFWNSLIQSHQEQKDPRNNPISLSGRLHIINGLLKSQNVWDACAIDVPIKIYHGLKNCVVNIKQAQLIKKSIAASNSPCELNLVDIGHKILNFEELLNDFL